MNAGTFLFYMKLVGIALIVGGVIGWIVELLRRRALDRERDELTAQLEEAQQEIERLREFEDELYRIWDEQDQPRLSLPRDTPR
jgi:uncharacterized membrane-anchored protein YhcB (DUF1043 family)